MKGRVYLHSRRQGESVGDRVNYLSHRERTNPSRQEFAGSRAFDGEVFGIEKHLLPDLKRQFWYAFVVKMFLPVLSVAGVLGSTQGSVGDPPGVGKVRNQCDTPRAQLKTHLFIRRPVLAAYGRRLLGVAVSAEML